MLLHRNTFVQKAFFTQILLQRGIFARILSRRDAFTHRCFETRTHLGKRLEARFGGGIKPFWNQVSIQYVLTERCFYTIQVLLHREGPSDRDGFTQRDDFTKGCFFKTFL
jgi:hypothetical protein